MRNLWTFSRASMKFKSCSYVTLFMVHFDVANTKLSRNILSSPALSLSLSWNWFRKIYISIQYMSKKVCRMVSATRKMALITSLGKLTLKIFFLQTELAHFLTKNNKKLFMLNKIFLQFLLKDSSFWEQDLTFIETLEEMQRLKVINGLAERGLALIQTFNSTSCSR